MSKPMDKQQKYIDIINQLDNNYKKIKASRPLPQDGVTYFIEQFAISTTFSSNAIEGNTFTYDETKLLLEKGITASNRSFREHEEIVGYKQAFDYIYNLLKGKLVIDENLIKTIHSYVLYKGSQPSEYRTIQNYIGDIFQVKYTPCPPAQVPTRMQKYVEDVNADMQELSKIYQSTKIDWKRLFHILARHHIEFEKIHPFVDGNGRTGRLLLTTEMMYLGLLPIDIRYEQRKRYYSALDSYDNKSKYSSREESKTEKMAKLFAECQLMSTEVWLKTFSAYTDNESTKQ